MVQRMTKRSIITIGIVLLILLIVIGGVVFTRSLNSNNDPYTQNQAGTESSNLSDVDGPSALNDEQPDKQTLSPSESSSSQNTPDPSTVSTLDVTSMSIRVAYVKGIGAFEYEVQRAANSTRYVEFRSEALVGTKCTDDKGTFASILVNPTADEKTTLSKTIQVGDMTYGLSLAETTCTSDSETLRQYQQSFSDAFSLLKPIE